MYTSKKKESKVIKTILTLVIITISLLCLYCVMFSPFHFWFMKNDTDLGYYMGSRLSYCNGKLNICYNDYSRLDTASSFWTQSKMLCDKATMGNILSNNICYIDGNQNFRICDLNGNGDVVIAGNCTKFTTDGFNKIFFADESNQLFVYYIDKHNTEKISSIDGDIYELLYHNNLLYVISQYYDNTDNKYVCKSSIKFFDSKSFQSINNLIVNMNDLKINSCDCHMFILDDYVVFFGNDLGTSYYSVDLYTKKITYLGEYSTSVSCTNNNSIYFIKSLYSSSIYNSDVKEELWRLDVSNVTTKKISDFDVEYYEMLCTDNYIYLYRPINLFSKQNTLFNISLGYEVKQMILG